MLFREDEMEGGGAAVVLSLRTLSHNCGRWNSFWNKLDQYGFPVVA